MIYISESDTGASSVTIKVEGTLTSEYLPVFEEVYAKHVDAGKRIAVDLGSVTSVERSAKAILKRIRDEVQFIDMPAYLKLEIGLTLDE